MGKHVQKVQPVNGESNVGITSVLTALPIAANDAGLD